MQLDFYFDFSCPFAYLASTRIEAIAARTGATLTWKPMLLGGVFRALAAPQSPAESMSPAKLRHNGLDMLRWAERLGVPLRVPAAHPMRTVKALRALLALPEPSWPAFAHAVYRAYWQRGQDVTARDTLAAALAEAGVTGAAAERALAADEDPAIKQELVRRTDEAIARGVFGAPTMFVGDGPDAKMYWGQDRLHMVEEALGGAPSPSPSPSPSPTATTWDFWYDFSSPFSYLAATQVEAVAARTGTKVVWRPMLLGALFKQIGTADVPLLQMSESRRRYFARDLTYWAEHWKVPFRFTSRFPMRTVTALRLALAAGDRIAPLSQALFRALWVDDRDLADPATLSAILDAAGFDADATMREAESPAGKQRLFDATAEAVARGVFGAPTFIVDDMLFWGQDRVPLVERVLAGWRPACG
jgi:2-hydroxychromene-2-carboxylate isomerase